MRHYFYSTEFECSLSSSFNKLVRDRVKAANEHPVTVKHPLPATVPQTGATDRCILLVERRVLCCRVIDNTVQCDSTCLYMFRSAVVIFRKHKINM